MRSATTVDEVVEQLTDWIDAAGAAGRTGREVAGKMYSWVRADEAWTWLVKSGCVARTVEPATYRGGRPRHTWRLT